MVPICLQCLNCTKFGQLILRKTIKIVATRGQILRLKCTKFDFGWGSAPDPAGGVYSAPPDPLAGFKGPTSKGGEGKERRVGEGEGKGFAPLADSSGSAPAPIPPSWNQGALLLRGGEGRGVEVPKNMDPPQSQKKPATPLDLFAGIAARLSEHSLQTLWQLMSLL